MKGLYIFTTVLTSLLIACAHSKTNTASVPCQGIKVKNPNENLTYNWSYYAPIESVHSNEIEKRLTVLSNGTLLINNFSDKDYGEYVCHIKDGNSIVEKVSVQVNYKYLPIQLQQCPSYSCINKEKCNSPDVSKLCPDQNDVCCPTMQEEDKHRCQHFLGECMASCHVHIRVSRADDCPNGTMCCVLI